MAAAFLMGDDWAGLLARLPAGIDLEATAAERGALIRRRGVADASRLLRLALVYGGTALSLRGAAAWARTAAVADLSDVALMYRLQGAEAWLGWLLQELLSAELGALAGAVGPGGWRLRLVDGTALAPPGGAAGIAWRVHAGFDLGRRRFDHLELTSGQASESLERFTAAPGEILIADRFDAKARGVHHIAAQGGHLIVRRGLTACRLLTAEGAPLDAKAILALARTATERGALVDLPVQVPAHDDPTAAALSARLIIQRKPPLPWVPGPTSGGRSGPGSGHPRPPPGGPQGPPPARSAAPPAARSRRRSDADDHAAGRRHARPPGDRPRSAALADRARLQAPQKPDRPCRSRRQGAQAGESRARRQADPRGALREPGRPRPCPFPLSPSRPSGA